MKWLSMAAILLLFGTSFIFAQKADRSSNRQDSEDRSSKENAARRTGRESADRSQGGRKQSRSDENEVRVQYDQDRGRLSIDVDEDIPFRGKDDGSWAREGDFDIRYDADENILKLGGEGTVDVERAASRLARWWESWWKEERSARRSLQAGSESGARLFVRENDKNDDGHLSRKELRKGDRNDFHRVDQNEDGYLSVSEVRRYGQDYFELTERPRMQRHQAARPKYDDESDRTWSEWWASWWSEQDEEYDRLPSDARREILSVGASQFIEKHDRNGDGKLVRNELPDSMYDDFRELDDDGDREITRQEILQHIPSGDRQNQRQSNRR